MIVLNQHHVIKPKPVIDATAGPDREFIKQTEAGGGFARIRDLRACPGYCFDELSGKGGDTAHSLHEIERRPFALQYSVEGTVYFRRHCSLRHAGAIGY